MSIEDLVDIEISKKWKRLVAGNRPITVGEFLECAEEVIFAVVESDDFPGDEEIVTYSVDDAFAELSGKGGE